MKRYSLDIKDFLCKLSHRNKYDAIASFISKEIFQAVISNKNEFHPRSMFRMHSLNSAPFAKKT